MKKIKAESKHKDMMDLKKCWHAMKRRSAEVKAKYTAKENTEIFFLTLLGRAKHY